MTKQTLKNFALALGLLVRSPALSSHGGCNERKCATEFAANGKHRMAARR
jgi:hypothetical protein